MLRFKRDDGTSYPDWGANKITEVAETYIGLVTTMTAHYVPNGVPLIRNSDIKENKFVFKDPIYLDSEFAEKNKTRAHELGDIITVHTGDVGTSAVINQELEGSIGFATIVTRIIDKEKIIPQFVCWYYNSPKNKKIVINLITGDGRNNLNMRDFNKLVIPIPCSEEQQKIANFLSEVDNIIAASEQEIESLEMQKKGAMQKIFSQEVRFKADDGSDYPEWEECQFKNMFKLLQTNTYSRSQLNESCGEVFNIHYGDVLVRYGSVINANEDILPFINEDIEHSKFKKESYIQDGDIIIADTAEDYSAGKVSEVRNVGKKKILSGLHTMLCRPQKKFASMYLGYYMNCNEYHSQIVRLLVGTKVYSINKSVILQTTLKIPCLEEQQKIADFFSEFDITIEYTKEELEVWKNIKKGLLQQMFE